MKTFLQDLLRRFKRRKQSGIKYICPKCQAEETIPQDVLEYFDTVDPERLLYGPSCFRCEKCGYPYMQPEHYEDKVMGFGLDEELKDAIKSKNNTKN